MVLWWKCVSNCLLLFSAELNMKMHHVIVLHSCFLDSLLESKRRQLRFLLFLSVSLSLAICFSDYWLTHNTGVLVVSQLHFSGAHFWDSPGLFCERTFCLVKIAMKYSTNLPTVKQLNKVFMSCRNETSYCLLNDCKTIYFSLFHFTNGSPSVTPSR